MISMLFPLLMWGLGAVTFLVQYACRVSPSVMITPLRHAFSIEASEVGQLAAAFYYSYLCMQLFVGRLVDRYPAHRVLMISAFAFFIGNQWLSEAVTLHSAFFARMLQGMSGAFSFVVSMRLAMLWFDRKYLATLAGCTQVLGMIGVVFGNVYVDYLLIDMPWRAVVKHFSLILIAIVIAMLVVMKQNPHEKELQSQPKISILEGLKQVMGNPQSWFNAMYAGFLFLPTAAFGEFWGIEYLMKTHVGIGQHDASVANSCIFIGWAIGGILVGILSDYLQKRQQIMGFSAVLSCALMAPVLYWYEMPIWLLKADLLLYGIVNTGLVLSYATAGELNGERCSGTSVAFCNMGSILCGTLAMPLIGRTLDLFWTGILEEGVRVYELQAYQYAFSWMPLSFLVALLLSRYIQDPAAD